MGGGVVGREGGRVGMMEGVKEVGGRERSGELGEEGEITVMCQISPLYFTSGRSSTHRTAWASTLTRPSRP